MAGLCIKKGCNWTRTHGYFCQKHRVPEPLVDTRVRCAAVGCYLERKSLTLFCDEHQRAMDRDCGPVPKYLARTPVKPFRAPLPDRNAPARPISRDKLVVKWRSDQRRYEAKCRSTNVVGHGDSPGAAIRNWQWWWSVPF